MPGRPHSSSTNALRRARTCTGDRGRGTSTTAAHYSEAMANELQITFDAANPPALAEFWQVAMGYVPEPPPHGFDSWEAFAETNNMPPEARDFYGSAIDPDGVGPRLLFLKVPEPKTTKNRVHLDIAVEDREAHVTLLVRSGATKVETRSEFGSTWTVMTDPEGNEFCVTSFSPEAGRPDTDDQG